MSLMFLKLVVCPPPLSHSSTKSGAAHSSMAHREVITDWRVWGFAADFLPLQPLAETDTGTWHLRLTLSLHSKCSMLGPQTPPRWSLYSPSYFSVDSNQTSLQERLKERAQQTALGPSCKCVTSQIGVCGDE